MAGTLRRTSSVPGSNNVLSSAYKDTLASLFLPELYIGIPFRSGSFLMLTDNSSMQIIKR